MSTALFGLSVANNARIKELWLILVLVVMMMNGWAMMMTLMMIALRAVGG